MTVKQASYTVEYVEWTGENGDEVEEFLGDAFETLIPSLGQVVFRNNGVELVAEKGDEILRAPNGELFRLPTAVFEETYTPETPWTWRLVKHKGKAEIDLQVDPALTEGLTGEELKQLIDAIAEVMANAAVHLLFGPGQRIND